MESSPIGKELCLYEARELDDVIGRMAWQAAGFFTAKENILIVGILRRGAPLAERLHTKLIQDFKLTSIKLMHLEIQRYADDLTLIYPETKLTENQELAQLDLSRFTVLIVDDVIFRGHSMLRAVEYIARRQAAEIRTAVLVDRCANKLPVRIDIAGIRLDVTPNSIVKCNVPPFEAEFKIDLYIPNRN